MKPRPFYSMLRSLLLVAAGCSMYACTPDKEEASFGPKSLSQNILSTCTDCQFETLYKSVANNNEPVGTVAICQTATEITLTYTLADDRDKAWFQIAGYNVYTEAPAAINPGSLLERASEQSGKPKQVSFTIGLESLGSYGDPGDLIYLTTYAVVPGKDGTGGMVWAGQLKPATQNPNSRYFTYIIKDCGTPPPPTENCTFTQGFWFAKPGGSQWPGELETDGIEFGGQEYTYKEARAIFFGKNAKTGKTVAKQAFLQGLALKLSIGGGKSIIRNRGL